MKDWQKRVIEERNDLETKMQKLHAFIGSKEYQKIAYNEQEIISRQYRSMDQYYKELGNRITTFILGD